MLGNADWVKNYDKDKQTHSSTVFKQSTALGPQINGKLGTEKLLKGNKERFFTKKKKPLLVSQLANIARELLAYELLIKLRSEKYTNHSVLFSVQCNITTYLITS